MIPALIYWSLRRLLELMVLLVRSDAANQVEILVLRQELMVLPPAGSAAAVPPG